MKLSLSQPMNEFSNFCPTDSLPHPPGGEQESSCVVLSCPWELNHNTYPKAKDLHLILNVQ